MPAEAQLPVSMVLAFLMVLCRVSGAFFLAPMPGSAAGSPVSRIVLALAVTVALMPFWPSGIGIPSTGQLLIWLLAEAGFGLAIGLVAGLLTEAFVMFGHLAGLQAGYGYASVIDPNTQGR